MAAATPAPRPCIFCEIVRRDLPDHLLGPFFAEVRRVTVAVQDGLGADGVFVAQNNVVSQSVPHLHVHVVPRRRPGGNRGACGEHHSVIV